MCEAERIGLMWARWFLLLVRLGFVYSVEREAWIAPDGEVCGE